MCIHLPYGPELQPHKLLQSLNMSTSKSSTLDPLSDFNFRAFCSSRCNSATPLTTSFAAPASCTQFWTPDITLNLNSVQFTRTTTHDECVPPPVRRTSGAPYCGDCSSSSGAPWMSPGLCPQSWTMASTGIANSTTTGYCCPP